MNLEKTQRLCLGHDVPSKDVLLDLRAGKQRASLESPDTKTRLNWWTCGPTRDKARVRRFIPTTSRIHSMFMAMICSSIGSGSPCPIRAHSSLTLQGGENQPLCQACKALTKSQMSRAQRSCDPPLACKGPHRRQKTLPPAASGSICPSQDRPGSATRTANPGQSSPLGPQTKQAIGTFDHSGESIILGVVTLHGCCNPT